LLCLLYFSLLVGCDNLENWTAISLTIIVMLNFILIYFYLGKFYSYFKNAYVLQSEKKYEEAIEYYKKSMQLKPIFQELGITWELHIRN